MNLLLSVSVTCSVKVGSNQFEVETHDQDRLLEIFGDAIWCPKSIEF